MCITKFLINNDTKKYMKIELGRFYVYIYRLNINKQKLFPKTNPSRPNVDIVVGTGADVGADAGVVLGYSPEL